MRGALHISSSESANIMTNCMDFLSILAIFGGFLGDVKFGRYIAIVVFAFICTLGMTFASPETVTYDQRDDIGSKEIWVLYLGLYIIAFGCCWNKFKCIGAWV
ncbi:putative ABC-type nitrate transporter [Helianthus annuus]|nr:putative ABC-type nitrate transporter [Helianthus annuus]